MEFDDMSKFQFPLPDTLSSKPKFVNIWNLIRNLSIMII
jgi:hypothetical protein